MNPSDFSQVTHNIQTRRTSGRGVQSSLSLTEKASSTPTIPNGFSPNVGVVVKGSSNGRDVNDRRKAGNYLVIGTGIVFVVHGTRDRKCPDLIPLH